MLALTLASQAILAVLPPLMLVLERLLAELKVLLVSPMAVRPLILHPVLPLSLLGTTARLVILASQAILAVLPLLMLVLERPLAELKVLLVSLMAALLLILSLPLPLTARLFVKPSPV